jgi:hypothetical protein
MLTGIAEMVEWYGNFSGRKCKFQWILPDDVPKILEEMEYAEAKSGSFNLMVDGYGRLFINESIEDEKYEWKAWHGQHKEHGEAWLVHGPEINVLLYEGEWKGSAAGPLKPKRSGHYPLRSEDCQLAVEDRVVSIVEDMTNAGDWHEREAIAAIIAVAEKLRNALDHDDKGTVDLHIKRLMRDRSSVKPRL